MNERNLETFEKSLGAVSQTEIRGFSPLNLAYIGDTVFDLYVRQYLVKNQMGKVTALHKKASTLVNARAQAHAAQRIAPLLTETETSVFRRGKNAKSTPPKNMSVRDYSLATAIEAVIGYLFCLGKTDRLDELFRIIITQTEDENA